MSRAGAGALALVLVAGGCMLDEVRAYDDKTSDGGGGPGAAPPLVDLTLTSAHGCAAAVDGKVYCWGLNVDGVLGVPQAELTFRHRAGLVAGVNDAVGIAAGASSCATLGDGSLVCWGAGITLGDGVGVDRATPAAAVGLSGVIDVALAGSVGCAVVAGGGYCWGGTSLDILLESGGGPTPGRAIGISGATAIARGVNGVGCAVVAGGEVRCWGNQSGGVLGNGQSAQTFIRSPAAVVGLTGAVEVAAGASFTCARLGNGGVSCWGMDPLAVGGLDETCPALGGGTYPCQTVPRAVAGVAGAISLAGGDAHVCAAIQSGEVLCWGNGELGNGTAQTATPTLVAGVSDVVQVVAAAGSTCARRQDHQVLCWGDNANGQLGNGGIEVTPVPTPVSW